MHRPHGCALGPDGAGGLSPRGLPASALPLTVFLLQNQDHIRLLQGDLVRLLGQIGLGDLHLGQVCGGRWGGGQGRSCPREDVGSTSRHFPRGLVSGGPGLGTWAGDSWQLPPGATGQAAPARQRGQVAPKGRGWSQADDLWAGPAPCAPGTGHGPLPRTDEAALGQSWVWAGHPGGRQWHGRRAGRYLLAPCRPPAQGRGRGREPCSRCGRRSPPLLAGLCLSLCVSATIQRARSLLGRDTAWVRPRGQSRQPGDLRFHTAHPQCGAVRGQGVKGPPRGSSGVPHGPGAVTRSDDEVSQDAGILS